MVLVVAALGWRLGSRRRSKFCTKTKGFMRVYFQFGAARASGMALLRLTRNKA